MSQSWVLRYPSSPLRGMPWSASENAVGLKTVYRGIARPGRLMKTRASEGWHSDITFEKIPSDYAVRGFLLNSNAIISPKYTDPQVTHTPSRYVSSSIFCYSSTIHVFLSWGWYLGRSTGWSQEALYWQFLRQWASGYEAYDRLSPAYQKFLEGLTATHDGGIFNVVSVLHYESVIV